MPGWSAVKSTGIGRGQTCLWRNIITVTAGGGKQKYKPQAIFSKREKAAVVLSDVVHGIDLQYCIHAVENGKSGGSDE